MDSSQNIEDVVTGSQSSLTTNLPLPPLLREYEEFTRALQNQIEFLKSEHLSLRSELKTLIVENHQLSEELKSSQHPDVIGSLSPRHRKDLDMVSNLQQRLLLTVQEKDSAIEMWQLAIKEVDTLEYELKTYENNQHVHEAHKQLNDVKQEYSTAITLLEERLVSVSGEAAKERMVHEEMKRNLTDVRDQLKVAVENIGYRDSELMAGLDTTKSAIAKMQELEEKIKEQSEELNAGIASRDELEQALIKSHERIKHLTERDQNACHKVHEALMIVEEVVTERETAMNFEALTKEENMHLQMAMADLIEEAGQRVKLEVDRVKEEYNKKTETLIRDLKQAEKSLAEKLKLLERAEVERKQLTDELEALRRDTERPLLSSDIEHKVNMAYRELTESERRNCQAGIELDALKLEIKRLKESHKRDHERKTQECRLAFEEISSLQTKVEFATHAQNTTAARCAQLEEYILTLEVRIKHLQKDQQHKCDQDCENFSKERSALYDRLQEIQKRGVETVTELQQHLDCQKELADKWQRTVKIITKKFEVRLQDLRSKASQTKLERRELQEQLNVAKREIDRLTREQVT